MLTITQECKLLEILHDLIDLVETPDIDIRTFELTVDNETREVPWAVGAWVQREFTGRRKLLLELDIVSTQ